jgi:replicative DNA helicase
MKARGEDGGACEMTEQHATDSAIAIRSVDNDHAFALDDLFAQVRSQAQQRSFGWRTLDRLDIGFNPGDLSIVAGRTGHGKSTVLLNILLHWIETYPDQRFFLFSYEIPPTAVAIKLLSTLTRKRGGVGWSYHDVRRWLQEGRVAPNSPLKAEEIRESVRIMERWQDRLTILYEPDWNVTKLADYTRSISGHAGAIGGILVDYVQLVQPPLGRYENREHEVTIVAKELKRLAVETRSPVVTAAQIGREAAQITDWVPDGALEDEKVLRAIAKRRPQLHHLREGGGEREADLVIGLLNYRADYLAAAENAGMDHLLLETGHAGPFDLAVLKNRYGQLGLATLVLESRTGYLRDPGVFGR